MRSIDLNCDLGEGCGNDAELMKYISSANIACGFHAGDRETMRRTVCLALERGVSVGAHPSYRDRENFGRTEMSLSAGEIFDIAAEQIATLNEICNAEGAELHHVKPHGALYNQAAREPELAAAIAEAVAKFDADLILYGLSGSHLISEAERFGLRTASEVFADRTYQSDGSLTPRSLPNALIEDDDEAVSQALQMAQRGEVLSTDGDPVSLRAETICLHGDGEHAVSFAIRIRSALESTGWEIAPPDGKE